MKVLLSTDSSCTIEKSLAEKLSISVFPLNVIVDGEEFLDGISIDQDQLCASMRANKIIKTSTPPQGSVVEYFKEIFDKGYDKVVHFTISSKLSSMYNLFETVSRDYFDNKIIVIDSYAVCTVMLSHVLYAHELINKNVEPEEIKKIIEERKTDNYCIVIPENLNALKNGGRIKPAIATLCNLVGVKPVLAFVEGGLEKECLAKNAKKVFHDKALELVNKYPISEYDYAVLDFDGASSLKEYLIKDLSQTIAKDVLLQKIAINVCAHAGPGTLGIMISKKFDGKSLYDYLG